MSGRSIRRISVLGAGAGGLAAAARFAERGLEVALYNRGPARIDAVRSAGGVVVEGELGAEDRLIRLAAVTTDPAEAVDGADLVLCCAAANGQEPIAAAVAPHLRGPVIYLLAPGSAGSLTVGRLFTEQGLDIFDEVLLGEMMALPQSARMTGEARVRIRLPSRNRMAAFPAVRSPELYASVDDLIAWTAAPHVLDVGLNNVNFLIHPGPVLLNYAAIERAEGRLSLMNEGMTPAVLRCLDAVDAEKMRVCEALGLTPIDIDSLYRELGSGPHVYRDPGEPFGLTDRIWDRYVHEDTPFGTVMIASVGAAVGVPTPVTDGINTLLSLIEGVDFVATGRTAAALGLAGLDVDQITEYLHSGHRPTPSSDRPGGTP